MNRIRARREEEMYVSSKHRWHHTKIFGWTKSLHSSPPLPFHPLHLSFPYLSLPFPFLPLKAGPGLKYSKEVRGSAVNSPAGSGAKTFGLEMLHLFLLPGDGSLRFKSGCRLLSLSRRGRPPKSPPPPPAAPPPAPPPPPRRRYPPPS